MALSDYQLRNSTEYSGSSGEQTVTYKYKVPTASWESYIPSFGDSLADAKIGTVYFQSYSIRPDEDDDSRIYLDLSYTDSPASSTIGNKEDGDELWLPKPSTFERAIELHPGYLTKWNYDLYQKTTSSDSTPAWHATATDRSDTEGSTQWQWAKESPGDDWKLQEERTKPGVESYLYPAFAVQYFYYHATKANVEAILQTIATKQTPSETFGYSTGEWLVTDLDISEDGARYRGMVEFTHADVWDADLYGS